MCLLQRLVEEIQSKEPEKNALVRLSQNVQSTLNVRMGFPIYHSLSFSPKRSHLILMFLL